MAETYRIHVGGQLDACWADWFGGLDIRHQADGSSLLTGPLTDQAALHGVLARIRDLNLPLLAVQRVDDAREVQGEPAGTCDPSDPPR